MKFHFN